MILNNFEWGPDLGNGTFDLESSFNVVLLDVNSF